MPWVEMMATDVASLTALVLDLVDPPAAASDPEPIEEGTSRELEAWLRLLGFPVHRRTLQRWADAGVVPYRLTDDGRVIMRLDNVLELARGRDFGDAPPLVVS